MDLQKYTQKSLEVVQDAQNIAIENQNQQVEQEHILDALLRQNDSLILEILKKMNVPTDALMNSIKQIIDMIPKVIHASREMDKVYVTQDVDEMFITAEKKAEQMKDEYVSVEHIMLALIEKANKKLAELLKIYKITTNSFLKQLKEIRGNVRVTSQTPESTYNVLKKYGSDLVELAKRQKLDPVIGRDSEIRSVIRILLRKTKNNPVLIGEPGVRENSNCRRTSHENCKRRCTKCAKRL